MSKWLPTLITVAGGVATALAPQVQHVMAAHPTGATVTVTLLGLILHALESPVAPKS
jgi:hypothetical protein